MKHETLPVLPKKWRKRKKNCKFFAAETQEKSALFSCVYINFFDKTGRVLFFCTNLCITEIPVASWVFWHTYRPCPMIPSRWNVDACILHACDVSFTIANYNVMGTSSATDKCTKMLNSRWGLGDIWVCRKIRNPRNFTFYLLTPKMLPFSRRRVLVNSAFCRVLVCTRAMYCKFRALRLRVTSSPAPPIMCKTQNQESQETPYSYKRLIVLREVF